MKLKQAVLLALLGLVLTPAISATAQTFDLVISGGRVIDSESGLDAVRNIGIRNGKIAAISASRLAGKTTIDAKGLVVAPGFIDLHSHAVIALPSARMQVMDGVTTALELESGVLPVAGTYDLLAKEGRPLNYGFSVAWTFSRASLAMGVPYEKFSSADWGPAYGREDWHGYNTPEKSKRVLELIEKGLREGALGVGANLGYMPEANIDETYGIAKLTLKYGGGRERFWRSRPHVIMRSSLVARSLWRDGTGREGNASQNFQVACRLQGCEALSNRGCRSRGT